jgi:hypothetical protein
VVDGGLVPAGAAVGIDIEEAPSEKRGDFVN